MPFGLGDGLTLTDVYVPVESQAILKVRSISRWHIQAFAAS
jgi:hypothetical protein